ncbi:plasmid maintenance protein (plasmid) [Borreliella yangtzensis]|uniref:plasmid maintenance protein n=1 Tax=Borreliella yangtzensis TaxID=683292 RepID=UPI003BA2B814
MMSISINKRSANCSNKHQHKLIILISTLKYINNNYKEYSQQNILYYFNKNLKRNGQILVKLKTLQKYLYKFKKEIKVTTNYYKHLRVNCGTEIYYKLNYSKKECYQHINQFFKEKKFSRFRKRVNNNYSDKFLLKGSVNLEECLSNNIKEEKKEKKNPQKNYEHIRINIFNILIERLKNIVEIEVLKPIIKDYLNSKKKLEYNKAFGSYYDELLKIIKNENTSLKLKELSKKVI